MNLFPKEILFGISFFICLYAKPETLMMGAASGHYFENYVVSELMKSYAAGRSQANLSYYRDGSAKEIDVVIEENGVLHPLEIKKAANPNLREVRKFELLDAANLQRGRGGIVCMAGDVVPVDEKNALIPSSLL